MYQGQSSYSKQKGWTTGTIYSKGTTALPSTFPGKDIYKCIIILMNRENVRMRERGDGERERERDNMMFRPKE